MFRGLSSVVYHSCEGSICQPRLCIRKPERAVKQYISLDLIHRNGNSVGLGGGPGMGVVGTCPQCF